jgi:transcriptional regulator with XRE-family HTH domain
VAYRQAFGQRLRDVRDRAGISQEDVANAADMSRRYVGAIERGAVSPTLDRVVRLAVVLGVQPAELLPPI